MPQGRKWASSSRYIIGSIAILLILAGVSLALFPFLQSFYYSHIKPPTPDIPAAQESVEPASVPQTPKAPEKLSPGTGRLVIAKINLDTAIGYGVSEEDLKKGPGFYPQSGSPETGNVSIAGHRNAYGSHFYHLDKMAAGDEILLTYQNKTYRYLVDMVFETFSRDWSVIDPTPKPALTLTTCTPLHPINGQYNRLIVRAALQEIK